MPTTNSNANATIAAALAKVNPTAAALNANPAVKVPELKFQHYACAKQATQMITDAGKKFAFVNHKLITRDQDIMEYLDREIDAGLRGITKGDLLTATESDPMRAIKEAGVREYLEKQAELAKQAALGNTPDMGDYEAPKLNPLGTTGVANK